MDTCLERNVCIIFYRFGKHCAAKRRNLLYREEYPFHAPKVALATLPPATHSWCQPSARMKGAQKALEVTVRSCLKTPTLC